jgi:outer membrane protein assembly factor BamC
MPNRISLILIVLLFANACAVVPKLDEVIPDRRTEYKKSEALPDLEVPPDLTVDALEDPLDIPNEEATTLSEFERRKNSRAPGGVNVSGVDPLADEQWIVVQGNAAEIWPRLREFWINKGFTVDLDDAELGVLETDWLETSNQGISVFRDKFRLFTESGGAAGTTIIYLSGERQERIASESDTTAWIDIEKASDYEKQIISDMNLFFYGGNAPAGISSLTASGSTSRPTSASIANATRPTAEMLDLDQDKVYLALPDEFTLAWKLAEEAILKAGMFIESNDRSKGLYYVLYYEQQDEEKGLLSKLKFWGDDNPEGTEYQISLTGVGDKTELVILDNKGDWIPKDDATRILTYIRAQYNVASR